ncbi:MAG: hypothetical protein Q8941_08675 [Bacteroidota bacterium]|nr:hypothetical protein [Bacteroidota bacterium]
MRLFVLIIFLACTGLLVACRKNGNESSKTSLNIKLHDCTGHIFRDNSINLCFDSVISDSRCPANVECIWQGAATCKFSFLKNNGTYPLTLSTLSLGPFKKDTTLLGYKIELMNLTPYPELPPVPLPGNVIRAEVKITRL